MKTKVITIKKKGGGTRKQRVQVLASGKFKFIKNKMRKAGKAIKTRVSKPRKQRSINKQVTRSSGSHRMKHFSKNNFKNGFKGFLGGTGGFELTEEVILLGTNNPIATTIGGLVVAAPAGWWVGGKSMAGLIGGLAGAGLDIGLKLLAGRTGQQGGSRFRL